MQKLKKLRILLTSFLLISCAAPAAAPAPVTTRENPGNSAECSAGNQWNVYHNLTSWKYANGLWTFENAKATYTTNQYCIISVQKG